MKVDVRSALRVAGNSVFRVKGFQFSTKSCSRQKRPAGSSTTCLSSGKLLRPHGHSFSIRLSSSGQRYLPLSCWYPLLTWRGGGLRRYWTPTPELAQTAAEQFVRNGVEFALEYAHKQDRFCVAYVEANRIQDPRKFPRLWEAWALIQRKPVHPNKTDQFRRTVYMLFQLDPHQEQLTLIRGELTDGIHSEAFVTHREGTEWTEEFRSNFMRSCMEESQHLDSVYRDLESEESEGGRRRMTQRLIDEFKVTPQKSSESPARAIMSLSQSRCMFVPRFDLGQEEPPEQHGAPTLLCATTSGFSS